MKTLFPKRKPKILKYTPSPYVRKMESVEFDVKSDYRKFADFLRLSSDDLGKVKLPKKDELRKLNKETKPKPGKEDGGFGGLIGKLISSLPVISAIAIPALKIGAIIGLGFGVSSLFGTQPSTMGLGSSLFRPKGRNNRGRNVNRRGRNTNRRGRNTNVRGRNTNRRGRNTNRRGTGTGTRPGSGTTTRPARVAPQGSGNQRLGRSTFQLEQARRSVSPVAQPPVRSSPPTIKQFLSKLSPKSLKKLAFSLGKKFVLPTLKKAVTKIPIIGGLIDFLINYYIFKQPVEEAALRGVGSAIFSALGATVGTIGGAGILSPLLGTAGAFLGGIAGDFAGGWLYSTFFKNKGNKQLQEAFEEENEFQDSSINTSSSSGNSNEEEDDSVVPATHPETGSGYTIKGLLDYKGRPVIFSKAGATAFAKMIRDSMGVVKGSDIHSSQRSKKKNDEIGGATNSHHLYGNAIDIHGESQEWMKANGAKYGWKINNYPGSHGGHFNYKSSGSPPTETDSSKTSTAQPVTPVMGNLPSDYASSEQEAFAAAERYQASRKDFEVSRLTPAAEAATSDNVVVISQAPAPSQGQQGSQFIPVPIGGGRSGGSSVASIDPNQLVNSMHESLLLTKLANA